MVYLTDKNGTGTEMADRPTSPEGSEIEITPAMIEAGVQVIRRDFYGFREPLLSLEHADLVSALLRAALRVPPAAR